MVVNKSFSSLKKIDIEVKLLVLYPKNDHIKVIKIRFGRVKITILITANYDIKLFLLREMCGRCSSYLLSDISMCKRSFDSENDPDTFFLRHLQTGK